MLKHLVIIIAVLLVFPHTSLAANRQGLENIDAAFIRDGDLWLWTNGEEKKVTNTGHVVGMPQWSHDGQWISYQNEAKQGEEIHRELWVYRPNDGMQRKIYHHSHSPKWAATKNIIAFMDEEIVNVSDLESFYNVALGVADYEWLPNDDGMILASSAKLLPNGWTNPVIYKKLLPSDLSKIKLEEAEEFFTIPKEIKKGNSDILSIYPNSFLFSPSSKWISFIVSPTASWSMDSNMLTVLSKDGKSFQVLDEVILGVGKPKWAPSKDMLAYIAGGGRIVFGFKNKRLKVEEMPASGTLTPQNYAELDFTWINNEAIVTSRVIEKEWSNNSSEHPLPALYLVHISNKKQKQLTHPPQGYGDYHPFYNKTVNKLIWYRGKSLFDENSDVWIANPDGTKPEKWLENVDVVVIAGE